MGSGFLAGQYGLRAGLGRDRLGRSDPSAGMETGRFLAACRLAGPVSVFGNLGANSGEAARKDMQISGKTGVACKVPVGDVEVQVRSGPVMSCTDPLRPELMRQKSQWLLEVQAQYPLMWGIGLEYQGTALPSLMPLDHDIINQDVHLAMPICEGGKLRFGAKHRWESDMDPRLPTDAMQLYMGFELKRGKSLWRQLAATTASPWYTFTFHPMILLQSILAMRLHAGHCLAR